ncbi:MAG: hypothetical protein GC161_18900 [Planctomycetaceae bacterium]|nr:hypothetical protein [Planctomycetaceae bacterium]
MFVPSISAAVPRRRTQRSRWFPAALLLCIAGPASAQTSPTELAVPAESSARYRLQAPTLATGGATEPDGTEGRETTAGIAASEAPPGGLPAGPTVPPNAGGWVGEPPGTHAPVGVNLAGLADWSSEWPFVDVMKVSRPWLPQLAGFGSPWNTGVPLQLDANGWPILKPGEAAATIVMDAIAGEYPGGVYVCLYDGEGQFEFQNDAKVKSAAPGRIELDVTPSNGGIVMRIVQSNPANHVRNVRLVMPGFESTYAEEPFHPVFLERLAHYQTLRFMDWQRTNNSTLVKWSDRTRPELQTQADDQGVAPEYVVALSNRLGKHPWVCMPHMADDDFLRQYAILVRDTLHPDLKVYLELSNEVWNSGFSQAQYCQNKGVAEGLSGNAYQAQLRWYSKRAVQMFDIWTDVFGGAGSPGAERVVRVMGGQSSTPWTGETALDFQNAYQKTDVYAIAPYFGGSLGSPDKAPITVTWTVQEVLTECILQILGPLTDKLLENAAMAQSRGVQLVAYEGGQHLVGMVGWENNQALTDLFVTANRNPMMYWAYRLFLERWKFAGGGAFVAYHSCGVASKWGSWGSLEYQAEPLSKAHKYRALIDFVAEEQPVLHYGTTCGPLIGSIGKAVAGGPSMYLVAGGAPPGAPGFLAAAGDHGGWSSLPLPLDLTSFGATGCSLYVPLEATASVQADGHGAVLLPFAPPGLPQLVGQEFHFQFAFGAPGVNPAGATFSSGLRLVIQG